MTPASARLRGGVLLYASLQFVVLTTIAMLIYPGGSMIDRSSSGYAFLGNFFSDLGATRTWSGRPNDVGTVLFGVALGTLGAAFVAFAGAWRAFAFTHGRARIAGLAAQLFGTASGAAFLAVGVTPVNLALDLHNAFVIAAFGLLLGYAACITIVWWRNGATATQRAANTMYLLLVAGYVAIVVFAIQTGFATPRGFLLMVASQKLVAYASMLYVVYLTVATRRQLATVRPDVPL